MSPLLELRGVHAGYGRVEVLHGIDLAVDAGSVLAVLGPNGAGKTTLLRVASGMLAPMQGDLVVGGHVLTGVEPGALARAGVCTIPEGRAVFANLTVRENLWLSTYAVPGGARSTAWRSPRQRDEVEQIVYGAFPQLQARRGDLAGNLSGGEQQMLALGRALATRPGVLLVDELSMGLAPLIVEQLFASLGRLAREGVGVVLVEQFAAAALALADRAAIVEHGRITAIGPPASIRQRVDEAYLGEEVTT